MATRQPPKSHCAGGGAPLLERNRYFTGKFMTARDFQGEQDYLRSRHQLHNRLLHGWGIVCGLEVRPNPIRECSNCTVVVKAGAALDCYGREVILLEDTVFEIPRPNENDTISATPQGQEPAESKSEREELLLCLYYDEDEIELTPAIYNDAGCDAEAEQANRIREHAAMRLLRLDQVKESCWQGGAKPTKCRDDCDDQIPSPTGASLEPDCPCDGGIPLALLSFDRERTNTPVAIDGGGRRHLPINADLLTHIVKTNWRHGETMTLSHLRDKLGGRLEIRFDRKIRPTTENLGSGISEYTYIAQYGGVQDDIRFLPYAQDRPPFLEDHCVAVFQIDPIYLETKRRDDFQNKVIYVSLKCDFILDCRGIPVDGCHLGGELPTHSGRMGGVFESWFSIEEAELDRVDRAGSREPASRRSKPRRGDGQ